MKTVAQVALAALVLATLSACGARRIPYRYTGVTGVVTLTNLHPDRRRIYSTNYQQDELLPVCTPVLVQVVSEKKMIFTDTTTGVEYQYLFDRRNMVDDIPAHLDRYLGTQCPQAQIAQMSEADRAGIRDGKIYAGMSRDGVILAAGYPDLSETDLASDVWTYWKNRWDQFEVIFVDGLVQFVRD